MPQPLPARHRAARRRPSVHLSRRALPSSFGSLLVVLGLVGSALVTWAAVTSSPAAAATPVRAAFYYPWFTETWHADDKFHPSLGQYSSDDTAVLDHHMADLAYAGEDAVIASWWGPGTHREQTRFPALMSAAAAHGLTVTPYYEKEGQSDTSLATIQSDLAYLAGYEKANPGAFLHVDGKPVIFVYNAAPATSSCATVSKWKQATNGFTDWYVNMKVFSGYATCADQPSSWHQYGPASAVQSHLPYSYNVSPGFYQHAESTPRLTRDPARFRQNLADQVASGARWQLVTSFNEWGEGTAVESATEWATSDGRGTYIDAMHDAYGATATSPPATTTTSSSPTSTTTTSSPTSTSSPTASPTPLPTSTAPTADSYVQSDKPSANFGTSTAVLTDDSPVKTTYLKFRVGSAPPTTATLAVTALSKQSRGFVVHPAASGWTESTVDYQNAPAPGAATCGASGPVSAGQRVSIPIDLTACPMGPDTDVTLTLTTPSSTNLKLGSREGSTPPSLTLAADGPTAGPTATTSPTVTTSATSSPTATTSPTATISPTATTSPTTPAPPAGAVTKLLVFVEENHSLSQMQAGMPYTASLAKQYGYATSYTAITHPSLPNYIAIAGGQTYGITDDNPPSSHPLDGSSVFGQAVAAGKTAKVYADGMTSSCMMSNTGRYAVKHNPWPYFTPASERTPCASYDVPETALATDAAAGTLPNVGMVVPDLCNDAHDCSLSVADSWFQTRMQKIFAGPDWQSGHLAVVLTADEDDKSQGNTVLTVVIHPSQSGHVVSTPLTHYSLTRLYEDVVGTPHLNNAVGAPSMSSAFGLPMP
jgi:phosphatidylinositol-3-phosphatase